MRCSLLILFTLALSLSTAAVAQTRLGASDDDLSGSSASCIFGINGDVVFAPPGADCGKVAVAAKAPVATDFRPARSSDTGPWLPTANGFEKLYVHAMQRHESSLGVELGQRSLRGTIHEAFAPAPSEYGESALELRATTRLATPGSPERARIDRHVVVSNPTAYEVVASNLDWFDTRRDVSYARPYEALPEQIAKGAVWDAGSGTVDGVHIRRRGEVLGFQDAKTPAGPYKQCLVVRYHTKREGTGSIDGQPYTILSSESVRTEWLARGVGMVLAKEEVSEVIELDGQQTEVRIEAQTGLQGVKRPSSPASRR